MISERIEGLFDTAAITVRTAPIDRDAFASLPPAEAALVEKAIGKRRHEFATARALVRESLAALGITGFSVVHDADRAPVWPEGIAGSITHCDSRACVAIARRAEAGTFGVDIEHRPELPERLWRMVFLAEEQAYLGTLDPALRAKLALVLFSAKESLYKAQHPRTRLYMGFSELRVHVTSLDPGALAGTLGCEFQRDVGVFARGAVVPGRFLRLPSGEIVSGVHITDANASRAAGAS